MSAAQFSECLRSEGALLPAERYTDNAMTDWLPALADPVGREEAAAALEKLAAMLVRDHQDYLLRDLLDRGASPDSWEAARELADAIRMNSAGSRGEGYRRARKAAELFRNAGNSAGVLRAQVEAVYALSRSYQTSRCIEASGAFLHDIGRRRYPWVLVQGMLARAACLDFIGDFSGARVLYAKSVLVASQHSYRQLQLRAIGLEAASRTLLGDVDNARRLDHQGLAQFWNGVFSPLRSYQFYSDLSHIAEHNKRWHAAYLTSKEAVPVIEMAGNRTTEAMARYRLATFAGMTGRPTESFDQIRRADQLIGQLQDQRLAAVLRAENLSLMAKLYLENRAASLARSALATIRTADVAPSLRLQMSFHALQGTVALLSSQSDAALEEFSAAASIAEAGLRETRSARERAIWQRDAAPIFRQMIRALIDRDQAPHRALALWEQYRSIPIERSTAVKDVFSLDAFRKRLGRATLLSFVQFEDYLHGWLFDDRGIHSFRSNLSWKEAEYLCGRFTNLVSHRGSDLRELANLSRRLYTTLLASVDSRLDGRRILAIEPDGPCSGIPFEALIDTNGSYLIDRVPLITSPGAAAAEILTAGDTVVHPKLRAVIIGDPRLTGDMAEIYPELPDARLEAAEVARRFAGAAVLAGRRATLEAVQDALRQVDVFHFSGHGVSTSDDGTLLLSPVDPSNGAALLNGELLEDEALRCRLAVLSACHTAVGERLGPFNPQSLIQAFWRAGVPNVLATRWAVDSRVARRIVDVFYARLLEGAEAPIALQSAAVSVRTDPGLRHPAYWAGFHVFGSPIAKKEGVSQ